MEQLSLGPSNKNASSSTEKDSRVVLLTNVFIFSSVTGSYLQNFGHTVTKPGHGGGAIQFLARSGSIVIGI